MLVATRTCGPGRRARLAAVAAGCGFAIALGPAPAQAEGFFEALFGGLQRAVRGAAQAPKAIVAPIESLGDAMSSTPGRAPPQSEAGRGGPAYCVRLCDGRYFPVQPAANLSSRQMCSTLCPACETRIFYGSPIDNAVSADGMRYPDLPKAYAYRRTVVAGCSCNGRSPFGLARTDVKSDPTLRPGDIVVTREGLAAFRGSADGTRHFTPVDSYPRFSRSFRDAIDRIEVATDTRGSRAGAPSPAPKAAPTGFNGTQSRR